MTPALLNSDDLSNILETHVLSYLWYDFKILESSWIFHGGMQARSQEFPEGGSLTREASHAPRKARCSYGRGMGAAQGPQKLWGIWSKILKSSNFQALHLNFRKVLFFKTDYMIITEFYTI